MSCIGVKIMHQVFWWGHKRWGDNPEDLLVNGRVTLKRISKEIDVATLVSSGSG
jgi:hypothetical protein